MFFILCKDVCWSVPWLDVYSKEKNIIMSFSGVRRLVILQFCFVARIIPILGEKQLSSGSIPVIRSVPDTRSFCKNCWSAQWDSSPK